MPRDSGTRSEMKKKRPRVGLVLDLQWPYKHHSGIFAGTQQYAQQHDWISVVDEYADDTLAQRAVGDSYYDGVIGRANRQLFTHASRLGVPVVNVWNSSLVRDRLPGVFTDNAASGRMRAEHLLSRGFHNFAALICQRELSHKQELLEFQRVVGEAGFKCTVTKVPLSYTQNAATWRKVEHSLADWIEGWQLPIGVFVGPDVLGRMVAQLCLDRSLRIPEDVAMIAGRNEETFCENPRPSLTSVEMGFERVGYEAARLLDHLMTAKGKQSHQRAQSPEHIIVPPQGMVVRASTDFFAVDDPLVAEAMRFIAANSHRTIGPDDVARAVAAEKRTLQRYFRKHLGRPIAAEIRRVRIERAKRELAQSDASMQQVARKVGFGEAMRLYEVFRRELGVTPTEYRQQRRITYAK